VSRLYNARVAQVRVVDGDLLDQHVDVIVNAWNRNFIPWWLLLPQGVSGAIKRRGGLAPFRELRSFGILAAGAAVVTGAGRLPFRAIIHVAGLNALWRSSEEIVRRCVRNALTVAEDRGFAAVAMPLIGAGTGGLSQSRAEAVIVEEAGNHSYGGSVVLVRFRRE
jgi:O-acetyl-ADP-ribose deacetylase (regulator of RNase III)